jgi:exodeoxyribonuclease V beta subunit
MNRFEVTTIPLQGKNLIEASAGTGKTYSVSLMALRLILEKDIPADKILMVTFAEAAAAEMAERMRLFIKQAYEAALGNTCSDKLIADIVNAAPDSLAKLRRAYMLLDEINVYTIHGFCNKMLRELAFETDSDFDFDIIADDKAVFQEVFDNYWREKLILEVGRTYKDCSDKLYLLFFNKDENEINKKISADERPNYNELKSIVSEKINAYKKQYNYLTYDDLIIRLHQASKDSEKSALLSGILSKKYEAVFIDEFQDTDKNQFEIFKGLFPEKTHFYVGDPKQCIYTFRGADIDNYLLVKNDENILKYNMDSNYRSVPDLVEAVNNFYLEQKNPFKDEGIKYIKVNAHKTDIIHIEDKDRQKLKTFSIFYKTHKKGLSLDSYLVNRIIFYLTKCSFSDGTAIKPSDIAVLFRTNNKIGEIRQQLIEKGIPAIEVKSTSIFGSDEADLMKNTLKLLLNPVRENFIRFLSAKYIGFSPLEISEIDISEELQKVKEIKAGLDKNGIYYSLSKLIGFYHCEEQIREIYGLSYNRMKANVLQLFEILHAKIGKEKLSYELLLKFLEREKKNSDTDIKNENDSGSDHYEQQLESDENAVKLMTIHKSKGLEFPIVIFPVYRTKFNDDETLRVYYVALTRAKYKTDVLCFTSGTYSHLKFIDILNTFKNTHQTSQNFDNYRFEEKFDTKELPNEILSPVETPVPSIIDKNWKISSYSALATHSDFRPKNIENSALEDYERFVFEEMPRGNSAGLFLHSLFENANFCDENFEEFLKSQQSSYLKHKGENANAENYAKLIENVLGADYSGFDLRDLENGKRINELEYHLKIKDNTKIKEITNILGTEEEQGEAKISGLLMGFIDMIFEKNGKYYIIDWKSNYLGNTLDAYRKENMEESIKANNYDLQYQIYSIALCKFLEQRIQDFDFEKHFGGGFWVFLRGCRTGKESGIYHFPPDKKLYKNLKSVFS